MSGRVVAISLAVALSAPSAVLAYGYADARGTGTGIPGISTVSMGFGGARAVGLGDAMSVMLNPADIYRIPGLSISFSAGFTVAGEQVEDTTGRYRSDWISPANLAAGLKLDLARSLAAAAAVGRVSDFSFDDVYYTFDLDPGPSFGEIIEERNLRVVGGLYESVGGLSWRASDWLTLGGSAGLRFGEVSYDSTFEDRREPENDAEVSWKREESALCWHAGTIVQLPLGRFGASWASETDMYPARAAFGGMLYTDDSRQASFGAEVELKDPSGDADFLARVLGQFSPSSSLAFRGSLLFGSAGGEVESEELGLGLGSTIGLGRVSLDVGFHWSSSTRETLAFGYEDYSQVKDTESMVSVGMTWNP